MEQVFFYSKNKKIGTTTSVYKVKGNKERNELERMIGVDHFVDLRSGGNMYDNKEIVSRISLASSKTTEPAKSTFYTDSASLDFIERKLKPADPIQSNFYPITSAFMYFIDSRHSFSVLSSHPLGVGTRMPGNFDFMLDRRTRQDDGRGMGEAVLDQKAIQVRFLAFTFPLFLSPLLSSLFFSLSI